MHLVGAQFERLQRLLNNSQNISPQLATLYGRLSQMIHRHADYEHFTSTVFNTELATCVKYTRSQAKTTLTEANHLTSHAFAKHEKAIADLNSLKEKLWKNGETAKWGITDINIVNELSHLRDDKARAFTYMLPNATQELDKLREEAEYFTN